MIILNNILCLFYVTEKIFKIRELEKDFKVDILLNQISIDELTKSVDLFSRLYENFADVCYILSGYKEAREYMEKCREAYERALSIKSKIYPDISLQIAKSYADLGNVYYDKMEYDKSMINCIKALEIRKQFYSGQIHIDLANSLSQLSRLYRALSKDDQALKLEKESFEMKTKLFESEGDSSRNVFMASGYQMLGRIFYNF
jgi:tetratricopeptide (TPR) repeat protein